MKFDPNGDTSTLGDSLAFSATILKEKVSDFDTALAEEVFLKRPSEILGIPPEKDA